MTSPGDYALSLIKDASSKPIAVRVKPAAERALRGGHPWLFESAITDQSRVGGAGDLAVIFDRKNRFLAVGLYDPDSPIRVRILQPREPSTIDRNWFQEQVAAAIELRRDLDQTATTGFRLVHGENDGLPGLVVDRYDQTYVLKLYTAAWIPHLNDVISALASLTHPKRIVLRLSRAVTKGKSPLYGLTDGAILAGPPLSGPVCFIENGLRFEADVAKGQKTGFFFDQRDNRTRVERLAASKVVLNVFAFTGGFSLYAARGGAIEITSLDVSHPALEAAKRNFQLNKELPAVAAARHEVVEGDAFTLLTQLRSQHRLFDLVIMDPPSFAKRQSEVPQAMTAYRRLLKLGLDILAQGATLVMASCSSHVPANDFFSLLLGEARALGRPLREIERTGHAVDHPVGFEEGAYLKCMFAVVP